jgi:hypothetical protein
MSDYLSPPANLAEFAKSVRAGSGIHYRFPSERDVLSLLCAPGTVSVPRRHRAYQLGSSPMRQGSIHRRIRHMFSIRRA